MVAASVSRQSEGASIEVMLDRSKWYGAVVVHRLSNGCFTQRAGSMEGLTKRWNGRSTELAIGAALPREVSDPPPR